MKLCICLVFVGVIFCDAEINSIPDFNNLVNQYWEWRFEQAPEFATKAGNHSFDDKVEEFSIENLEYQHNNVTTFKTKLDRIDYTKLPPSLQVSYNVLRDTLTLFSKGYEWKTYGTLNPVNFLDGLWTDPKSFAPTNPKTYDDFYKYIQRIKGWGIQALNFRTRMNESIKLQTTNHWVSVEGAVEQIKAMIGLSVVESPLYELFNESLSNSTMLDSNKTTLRALANESLVLFRKNFQDLLDFIQMEYKNKTRQSFGVGSLQRGKEFYKACLKWHISMNITPEEIHQKGLHEVERIYKEMNKVMKRQNFNGTVKNYFDMLKKNTSFFLHSKEEILKRYGSIVNDRIKPKLAQFFKNVPNSSLAIKEMPLDGPNGMYSAGALDGLRPGVFYANVRRLQDNPTYNMVALVLHETDPGHHLQDIYSQSSRIPDFRRIMDDSKYFAPPYHFPFYTSNIEGWGLYAESLGEKGQLDIYQDDYELMGRYSFEIFRACRLVVDTGIHYYNWSKDEAIEYLLNYTSFTKESLTIEVHRYITWPGQACAYKIGEMKIKELRDKAKIALGNRFDIKEFHAVILENGLVPLYMVEQLVNEWIKSVKEEISRTQLDANEQFNSLVNEYWNWRLEQAPEFATIVQVPEFNSKVEQFTVENIEYQYNNVSSFLQRLQNINRQKLSSTNQVSYDVLKDTLEVVKDGYKWKDYGPMNPVNFLEGLWTDAESAAPIKPMSYKDFFDYIRRIDGWANQSQHYINRMRQAINRTTTNHWVSVKAAVGQIDDLVGSSEVMSPMFKPLNETLDNTTISAGNKTELKAAAIEALVTFRKEYKNLSQFIQVEYQNHTRSMPGVNTLPNGIDFYKACLKWHLSVVIPIETIHNTGLKEVDRIYTEMKKVMARQGFSGTVKNFFDNLKKNTSYILNSTEEIIERFKYIINNRVKPKLAKYFKNIPDSPIVVKPMPYDGPGGSYFFGSPDGSRPGIFYANVMRPADNPTYNMPALVLHEADPGHHLQDIYAQASKDNPTFRKVIDYTKYFAIPYHFPYYTAYTEGWGLYAESLGEHDQLDIYQDDTELMGRYSFEIFRACRLVVDTGLHYYNWTREKAIDYMLNYTSLTRESLTIEVDRYITWPGQACAYKIGELKIKELRKKAETALGAKFDIRDFHSVILDSGAVPLSILEQLVDDWIKLKGETLEKLMSDFWNWRNKISPEFSTSVPIYKYNDVLDSYKYDKFDREWEEAKIFRQRLSRIDRDNLTEDKNISYDILKNMLDVFIDGHHWKDYQPLNPINFLEGWFTGADYFTFGTPFDTQGDVYNYIRRIELMPTQVDEMMDLSRRAIENGNINHNVSVSRVPQMIESMIVDDANMSELYKPFKMSAGTIFSGIPNILNSTDQRLKVAINAFMSKIREFKTFLVNEYMPKTRPGLGIGSLRNGAENYQACLYFHTSINLTAEKIHEIGRKEVARIYALIKQKMKNVGFPDETTIAQMYQNLTQDTRFLLQQPEEILDKFREIIFNRIQPLIHKYIKNAPSLPLEVRRSPNDGIAGGYSTGTADGSRPGIFYANVYKLEYNPTYKMVSLSLHEAIPGHHLAESFGLVADVPDFRKYFEWRSYNAPYFFPFYNSFNEGWALYAESLGEEMGIYHNDYELLGRYSDEMLRACRLVIDTGIHHYNWTRQMAIAYMLNYTAETPEAAAIEIDRYVTWPGQATGYKIGELKIKELRKTAENALGSKFDIADFHYVILRHGAIPLDVLEKVVSSWIQAQQEHGPVETAPQPACKEPVSSARSFHNRIFSMIMTVSLILYTY